MRNDYFQQSTKHDIQAFRIYKPFLVRVCACPWMGTYSVVSCRIVCDILSLYMTYEILGWLLVAPRLLSRNLGVSLRVADLVQHVCVIEHSVFQRHEKELGI